MSRTDWPKYNRSLRDRGRVTFWFSKDAVNHWYEVRSEVRRGRPRVFSDFAIEAILTLRFKFSLTLREAEGFTQSLFEIMGVSLRIPNYTTLCRRLEHLVIDLGAASHSPEPLHIVVDVTGLKVFGEGEWKLRLYGFGRRRTWRKLNIAVDESDQQVHAIMLTDNDSTEGDVFGDLMDSVDAPIARVTGDGGYDDRRCYAWCKEHFVYGVFPPQRAAVIQQHGNAKAEPLQRDEHLRIIRKKGREAWKIQTNYHRRSIVETMMYRFKVLLGDKLQSREFQREGREAGLKCKILNRMQPPCVLH